MNKNRDYITTNEWCENKMAEISEIIHNECGKPIEECTCEGAGITIIDEEE